ncbi:MAG: DNA-processing protein DprA [Alphaproteobacteria bacterium]|nr:DNA-processing protein DprA [Alphaproteobacteria bacterium]
MQDDTSTGLATQERLDRLRLARSENVGPVTFRQLLGRYGSAGQALAALPDLAARGGRKRPLRINSIEAAERECEALQRLGGRHLFYGEPDYPTPLAALDDAPPALSILGDASLLARDTVAVVGARNASTNGRNFARTIAADLAEADFLVASGMARGIDAAAHAGALEHGTVAVLAGGVDVIYPKENSALYANIVAQGLVISELPCGVQPRAQHFPRRNRIISGLALGIVVVEAALRSGSLITARLAGEQGREVFAVPGSPQDPRCRGANDLIRKGAKLTESAHDVITELSAMRGARLAGRRGSIFEAGALPIPEPASAAPATPASETASTRILETLGPTPLAVDEIVRDTGFTPSEVWNILLDLELAGRLERQPGNLVALIS